MRISTKSIFISLTALLLIGLPFVYALIIYPDLADKIPVHYDINGNPDGWDEKSGIFLLPVIMGVAGIIILLLLTNLNRIDPKRYAAGNDKVFGFMGIFIIGFLSFLSLIFEYQTLHPDLRLNSLVFTLLGLFFSGMGFFMPYLKQNYFAGFKFPWTLESASNWKKTHLIGGKIWVIGGLVIILSSLASEGAISFTIFLIVVSLLVILPAVISYRLYKKEMEQLHE